MIDKVYVNVKKTHADKKDNSFTHLYVQKVSKAIARHRSTRAVGGKYGRMSDVVKLERRLV